MYPIEKNIPPPKRVIKYPIFEMEVGDSFVIPCKEKDKERVRCSALTHIKKICQKEGLRIKLGSTAKGEGVRIWRIK
jgi:hypothetical protein